MDIIFPEKFQQIARFTYTPMNVAGGDYCIFPNTFNEANILDGDVIYVTNFYRYKAELIEKLSKTDKKVIVISQNCDHTTGSDIKSFNNIIKWYSINVDIEHPQVEGIPSGIMCLSRFPDRRDKEKILLKNLEPKKIKQLLYIDYNVNVYLAPERLKPYDIFKDKKWAKLIYDKSVPFETYLDNVYHSKFVLCPRGNGMATHRPWETLYLKSIPVMIRNTYNRFFTDLPILFVDDWEEITESFLEREYDRITNAKWNMEMLNFSWWKNKICTAKF